MTKDVLKMSRFFLMAIFLLILGCESDENPVDSPVGGDAFRMEMVTINLPNTNLTATEYIGIMGSENIKLLRSEEHKLLFMVPSSLALGNQDLIISSLNNLKITYNIKDIELPDTPDAIVSPFQNNLNEFQATTSGNIETQNAINSFNQVYDNSSNEDKILLSKLYFANKTLFDDIILNDYNDVSGRFLNGSMQLLWKHKAAVFAMTGGSILLYAGVGVEKVAGAMLVVAGAYKAKSFGEAFAVKTVNTINIKMFTIFGENNRNSPLSGSLELQNDVMKTVSFSTVDRAVIIADETKNNVGTKLYFTYKNMYNDFVQNINPVLQWINTNIPFTNFNLVSEQILPSTSVSTINPIETATYSNLTLTVNSPNLSLVSGSLVSGGQLAIKVKIVGTTSPSVDGFINYSFNDEFSTFSGKLPITVSNTEPVLLGKQYLNPASHNGCQTNTFLALSYQGKYNFSASPLGGKIFIRTCWVPGNACNQWYEFNITPETISFNNNIYTVNTYRQYCWGGSNTILTDEFYFVSSSGITSEVFTRTVPRP